MAKTASLALLGAAVIYTVPDNHQTKTVRGEAVTIGSVHHPELLEFAGLVGRVNDDGTADIVIFPPSRDPKWITGVAEGEGAGEFKLAAG